MGVNAAQLLISRLNADASLQPRQVVLPTRLITRYSCGEHLADNGHGQFGLHPSTGSQSQGILIKPLSQQERRNLSARAGGITLSMPKGGERMSDCDKSDVNRLLRTFRHQEADRIPHLEFWVTSKAVYEYVLERELAYDIVDASVGGQSITPEDHVEFARRLGMDAVACNFSWRPNNVFAKAADGTAHYVGGSVKTWADLDQLEPPVPLAEQLGCLERYLRAAQGTGVGVFANFTSFFDSAMLAVGITDSLYMFMTIGPFERLMDICQISSRSCARCVIVLQKIWLLS
jgi:hypothetical protein